MTEYLGNNIFLH